MSMRKLMALALTAIVVLVLAAPALADGNDEQGDTVARVGVRAS